MPKVSIIIPIYNVEKYIDKCIESVINQTLDDIEIILIDDESPDNCPQMCDNYAAKDSRIKVIHKKNEGLGFARNSGLNIATGEYVTFLDSDDFVDLYTYEHLYNIAIKEEVDVLYYQFSRFTNENNIKPSIPINEITEYTNENIKELMLDIIASEPGAKVDHKIQCSSCTAIYKMSIIKEHKIRFHSERELISEDLIFNLDYLKYAVKAVFNSGEYYHYRENPISLTNAVRNNRIKKNYILYNYIKENIILWNIDHKRCMERNARLFIGNSRSAIIQYLQSDIAIKNKIVWLKEQLELPIWSILERNYEWKLLPLYQRIIFKSCYKKWIFLIMILSFLKNIIK